MTMTRPDVDLTDGAFYAGDSRSVYRWMRENEPVFRDRNGLAAASTYQAVIEAERTQRDEVEASLDLIQTCPTITLLLNKVRMSTPRSFGVYSYSYTS